MHAVINDSIKYWRLEIRGGERCLPPWAKEVREVFTEEVELDTIQSEGS